jgi:hypothetical protein
MLAYGVIVDFMEKKILEDWRTHCNREYKKVC